MKTINWGIIGCGGIANLFATSLATLEEGRLLAGASRTPGRAQEFADKHGMARVYTDYESLVADPEIDAVYVATTHNFHFENIRLCLEHGKHVLCEKPFTVNAAQTRQLMELAREKQRFMMEAVWTRFLPAIVKLQQVLAAGAIGDVKTVTACFCLGADFPAEHRLKNKALAGGALLDLGIYPITFANLVFGAHPERIQSSVVMSETEVDESSFYLLDYPNGGRAMLTSSMSAAAPNEGIVYGSKGFIRVPLFWGAQEFEIHRKGSDAPERIRAPYGDGENFRFEIAHAMECIAAQKTESEILPLSETLAVMQTMDTLRDQWGLAYPDETRG
ncbi:Gfo/Idh/MocA family protein, partial [Pontiella sp.]|uniref:Gfo/Idh/MocA family protein n=1 Tax=Pontiella sp. TaxID=2837462 RepID=UPI0035639242